MSELPQEPVTTKVVTVIGETWLVTGPVPGEKIDLTIAKMFELDDGSIEVYANAKSGSPDQAFGAIFKIPERMVYKVMQIAPLNIWMEMLEEANAAERGDPD